LGLAPVSDRAGALVAEWHPRALAALRIMSALLFMEHGTAKLIGFPASPNFAAPLELLSERSVTGALEGVGGLLLVLGLFSRPVAFLLSGEMAIGYFIAHFPRGFFPLLNGGDPAVLYCFVFLYVFVAGPGAWSLDGLRGAQPNP
jgi:putative oxidoreductase